MNTQSLALRLEKALEFHANHFEKTKHEDHELLKLAVKAAKYDYEIRKEANPYSMRFEHNFYLRNKIYWNPLEDDGDALRLAVKLEMDIEITKDQLNDKWVWVYLGRHALTESCGNDPYAATRRAIVRAAAEIGRGNT